MVEDDEGWSFAVEWLFVFLVSSETVIATDDSDSVTCTDSGTTVSTTGSGMAFFGDWIVCVCAI